MNLKALSSFIFCLWVYQIQAQIADFNAIKKSGLPVIEVIINNNEQITSKYEYLKGVIKIHEKKGESYTVYSDSLEIKGRGNSTFIFPKRPFRLKLKKSAGLLGMPSNRHWALLANFEDKTLARTKLAMDLSEYFKMPYSPKTRPVELIVGTFHWGTYELIEVPKIGDSRVNIEAINSKTGQVSGGVLFEFDSYLDENYNFRTELGNMPFVIKDPDDLNTSDYSLASRHFKFAKDILQNAENALFGDFFLDTIKGYKNFFEIKSIVNWYIIQELTKNIDLYKSSIYMYNDPKNSNKITFSPVWDFDFSMGNLEDAKGTRAIDFPWMPRFLQDPEFVSLVRNRYKEKRDSLLSFIISITNAHTRQIYLSQLNNFRIWTPVHYQGNFHEWYPTFIDRVNYNDEVFHLKKWLLDRITWMDKEYLGTNINNYTSVSNDLRINITEDQSIDTAISVYSTLPTIGKIDIIKQPKMGLIVIPQIENNKRFLYNPKKNISGLDSFYVGFNNGSILDTSLIVIEITPVNDRPEIIIGEVQLKEDEVISKISIEGLRKWISDPDDSSFNYFINKTTRHGSFQVKPDGSFDYIPNKNYFGMDTLFYNVSDQNGGNSGIGILVFKISPINDAPSIQSTDIYINEDNYLTKSASFLHSLITDPDDSLFKFNIIKPAIHGNLSIEENGRLIYKPNKDYFGRDSALVSVFDSLGLSDTGKIVFDISPINDPPLLLSVNVETNEDNAVEIKKSYLDAFVVDVDDDLFEFKITALPNSGKYHVKENGSILYTPNKNFWGIDSLKIAVFDTLGLSDTTQLKIEVLPVNDPPEYSFDTIFIQSENRNQILIDNFIDWKQFADVDNKISDITLKPLNEPGIGKLIIDKDSKLNYIIGRKISGLDEFKIALFDQKDISKEIKIILRIIHDTKPFFDKNIIIYPNPSHGIFQIDLIDSDQIEVKDFEGKTVLKKISDQILNKFRVDISFLPKGTYYLYLYKNYKIIGIKKVVTL